MGTFHNDKGELHGITLVVDTTGPEVYIGRCDVADDQGVVLLDGDVHRDGDGGHNKDAYVKRAAKFGFWKKYDQVQVPREQIASVRKLGDVPSA